MPKGNLIEVSFGEPDSKVGKGFPERDARKPPEGILVAGLTARIECRNGDFLKRMLVRVVAWTNGAVGIKVSLSAENRKWAERNRRDIETFLNGVRKISLPEEGREWHVLPNSRVIVVFCDDHPDALRFVFFVDGPGGQATYPAPSRVHLHLA